MFVNKYLHLELVSDAIHVTIIVLFYCSDVILMHNSQKHATFGSRKNVISLLACYLVVLFLDIWRIMENWCSSENYLMYNGSLFLVFWAQYVWNIKLYILENKYWCKIRIYFGIRCVCNVLINIIYQ